MKYGMSDWQLFTPSARLSDIGIRNLFHTLQLSSRMKTVMCGEQLQVRWLRLLRLPTSLLLRRLLHTLKATTLGCGGLQLSRWLPSRSDSLGELVVLCLPWQSALKIRTVT